MATAAPAAPAPSTGAGTGVATSPAAEGQQGQDQGQQQGRDIQRVDQLTPESGRKIRPIPAKKAALPGVDDIAGPSFELPPPPKNRVRTPDGKFASQESSAEHEPAETAPETEPASGPFKFAGVEFESREKAEANFSTLRGMHRAMEQRLAKISQDEGSARSRAWEIHRAYESALARIAELEGGAGGTRQISPQQERVQEAVTSEGKIDWALYRELRKQAEAAGRPDLAEQWLQEQVDQSNEARTKKMVLELLADKLQPLEQLNQEREENEARKIVYAHTSEVVTRLQSYVGRDGRPSYPEMHNPEIAREVGHLWTASGNDPRVALTESGMRAAIGLYRMWKQEGELTPAAVSAAEAAAAGDTESIEGPDGDADAGVDGGGAPIDRQPIAERGVPPEIKRLRQAFKSGGQAANLGFDR